MSAATIRAHLPQAENVTSSQKSIPGRRIRICHFTTAHSFVKSRSFHRQCLPLMQAGFDVRYVAPFEGEKLKEVGFVSVPCRKGRIRRALLNHHLLRELLRQDAHVYYFQDPELLPLALALKLAFGKCVVYDAYEDFPSMAAASQRVSPLLRPIAAKMIETLESMAAVCLDGVITADPLTLRRFARTGKSEKLVFHNFPNLDFFPPARPADKRFDLVYRGGISERTGTVVLLDALRVLRDRSHSTRTLLLGYFDSHATEQKIRNRIRELELDSSVEICGRIDHEDMSAALSQARIGICPLQAIPKFLLNIPVKVFEYWACSLPVIASDLPPIRPYFRDADGGLLFQPGNSISLARSIEWMLDHSDAAAEMGEKGRAAVVNRFNNRLEVLKLERLFAHLAARRATAEESFADA